VNPYRGCEIGCTYCFARYMHTFMEHDDPLDFEREIYVKVNAAAVLATTADLEDLRGRPVAIGTWAKRAPSGVRPASCRR
jgi:DNA repair photolyase